MSTWLVNTVVFLSFVSGIYLVFGVLFARIFVNNRKNRLPVERSQLIRMPAQALNSQIQDTSIEVMGLAVGITALMTSPFVFVGSQYISFTEPTTISMMIGIGLGVIYGCVKAWKYTDQLIKLKLGRDAELAVASELMKLQSLGYQVFHDVQADGFNIDHLVVGPNGVFAVETKGRHKRTNDAKNGQKDYVMSFENNQLNFPSWFEKEPLEQAERQAKWVATWLNKACGISLNVMPLLVFPGWFVTLKSKPPFPVVNHKQLEKTIPTLRGTQLDPMQINAVCYQVVQRCLTGK